MPLHGSPASADPAPLPVVPAVPPIPSDAWTRAWSMPGNDLACILAALWLYVNRGTGAPGAPILDIDGLDMETRERLFAEVKARRLNLGRFRAWPRDRAISAERLAKVADIDENAGTIHLKGMALELVKLLRA